MRGLSRGFWWALGTGLAFGGLSALFFLLFEPRSIVVDRFEGAAQHDPYYVLAQYLQTRGVRVHDEARWDEAPPEGAAVFWLTYEPLPETLTAWLGQGGQVWSFTDPDGAFGWQPTSWLDTEAPSDAPVPAVVDEPDEAKECEESDCWEERRLERRARVCGDDVDPDAPCMMAAQFDYGAGCLTLVEAGTLINEGLRDPISARRVDALLQCPEWPEQAWLIRDLESPWIGQLLWERAPEALLAACAVLLLLLWQQAVYMGAPAHPVVDARRSWLEHLSAVGRLSARLGVEPLVRGARAELRRKLVARYPELGGLEQAATVEFLVARLKLPEKKVARALFAPSQDDPVHTLALTRDMLVLWRTL